MLNAMGAEEYFGQPDTPGEKSPIGIVMVSVLAKNPGMTFEQARQEAHNLLTQAAGRKRYQVPAVLSPQEKAESIASMTERFQFQEGRLTPILAILGTWCTDENDVLGVARTMLKRQHK